MIAKWKILCLALIITLAPGKWQASRPEKQTEEMKQVRKKNQVKNNYYIPD